MDIDLNRFSDYLRKRISLTTSCHDCDYIPKHDKAGQVEYDNNAGKEVQYMFNGLKIIRGCCEGDWMTHIIGKLKGHHKPQEEKVFYEVLQRIQKSDNNIMMELGAYWAYFSMWFTNQTEGKSILIEPHPEKLKIGLANFRLNNLKCFAIDGFIGAYYSESDTFIDWDSVKFVRTRYSVDYLMKYLKIEGRQDRLYFYCNT